MFASLLILLVTTAAVAQAKQARLYSGTFGTATSTVVNPYPFVSAEGIATDESTHDVYMADQPDHRVEKFSSSGVFLSMLGKKVNKTAVEEGRPEAEQNVCPAPGHPTDACQAGEEGSNAGTFEHPRFLAVDNSSDTSKGDLYVGDAGKTLNEVQGVSVDATGGTYTLSFEGATTVPIAYNAPPMSSEGSGSVQAALEGLPFNFKGSFDTLRGSPTHYEIVFGHELSARNVPQVVANSSDLTGGTATATVTTLVQGGINTARVEKLDSSGHPVASWAEDGQLYGSSVLAPPAPISGPFDELTGIAVDASGNLWVSDHSSDTFEFDQEAEFLTGWNSSGYWDGFDFGPDGDLYAHQLAGQGGAGVGKFSAAGEFMGAVAPSKLEDEQHTSLAPGGLAIDSATDELYIDGEEPENKEGVVYRYDSSCHPEKTEEIPDPGCAAVEAFGAGLLGSQPGSAAIDSASSTNPLYVVTKTGVATFPLETVPDVLTTAPASPTLTSATLTGTINPSGIELNGGLAGCRFEWGETAAPYEHTVACDKTAAEIGKGSAPVEVRAPITGLRAGKVYHYRLVASNANDVNGLIDEPSFGQDLAFGPPIIEKTSALEVTAAEAVLRTQLDPNDLFTRVRVEYGTEAGVYTGSTSEVNVGAAGAGQTVTFELTGLESGVTYHYRVVAENVLGEGVEAVLGADQTFATQPVGTFSLLDGRGWELVSPPNKHGANVESIQEHGVVQAAAGGEAISYLANAPTETAAQGNTDGAVQILSTRSGEGWSSLDIATPHEQAVGALAGPGPEYKFFSSDLSSAIVEPAGESDSAISAEASGYPPYLRSDFPVGEPGVLCTTACYRSFVAENSPGSKLGEFLGASTNAGTVVFSDNGALSGLSAGQLKPISVLPGLGSPAHGTLVLGAGENTRNAISRDGSRVVWSDKESEKVSHLYLRDLANEETLQLDRNKGGSGKGVAAPVFQDASSDDLTIFFTDTQQLTPGAGAAAEKPDLYRCQVLTGEESGELECVLTDLTPANGSESANVKGPIPGASEDGSLVYFFANGVLAHNQVNNGAGVEEAKPAHCEVNEGITGGDNSATSRDMCNLYVSHDGTTTFIASLSSSALADWYRLQGQPTRVSPNGEWLEFMSQRPLTGYDSRDAATGRPVAEVYLYGASANRIVCASCDPSGSRPHGIDFDALLFGVDGGANFTWIRDGLVAATLPGYTNFNDSQSDYQDRYLSNSGRLFFNATDPLVPQDSNGTVDVYEYEPSGAGSCSESNATFSGRSDGCVDLISSGTSGVESAFLDASENGDDVFFLTAAQLSYRDTDSAYDVYDARVGGGETEPVKPIECVGDACQSFVEAPNDPTPDSLTFQGPGSLLTPAVKPAGVHSTPKKATKCARGKKLVKGKCVKRKVKPKKKKEKKARRANSDRGVKR